MRLRNQYHLMVICVLYFRRSSSISALLCARTSSIAAALSCRSKWSDVLYAVSRTIVWLERSRCELSTAAAMAVSRAL